jgi:hypothetical protein
VADPDSPQQAPSTPTTTGPSVGVDGAATSDNAVATAFDETSWRGTDLVAVHAWTEPAPFNHPQPVEEQAQDRGEHELLAERLAGRQEKYPDVTVRHVVGATSAQNRLRSTSRLETRPAAWLPRPPSLLRDSARRLMGWTFQAWHVTMAYEPSEEFSEITLPDGPMIWQEMVPPPEFCAET